MQHKRYIVTIISIALLALFSAIVYAQTVVEPKPDAAGLLPEFNRWRTAIGIRPYQEDVRLSQSAQFHSDDQVARRYFSHNAPSAVMCNGQQVTTPAQRAACFGTKDRGEGIADGYSTPDEATRGWLSSYGHCTGVMNPSATHMGGGSNGAIWTFQFNGLNEPASPVDHESFCRCTSSGDGSESSVQACVVSFNNQFNGGAVPPVPPASTLQETIRIPGDKNATLNNRSSGGMGNGIIPAGTVTITVVPVSGNPSGIPITLKQAVGRSDIDLPGGTGTDSLTYVLTEPTDLWVWFDSSKLAQGDTFYINVLWESDYVSPSAQAVTPVTEEPIEASTVIEEPIQSSCSANTGAEMTLSATNNTDEPVSLIWIDTTCSEVLYHTIEAGQAVTQGTFEGHDWIVRNASGAAIKQYVASVNDPNIVIGSSTTSDDTGDSTSTSQCPFSVTSVEQMIDAINQANDEAQCPGPDTITLTSDLTIDSGYEDGDTAFPAITSTIIIDGLYRGDDGSNFTINRDIENAFGTPQFRFFLVDGMNGNEGELTLQNMSLTNGYALDGGAVFVDARDGGNASISVDNVVFANNAADGNGGAVMTLSMNGGTVKATINNSTFLNSSGSYGGAFYSGGFDGGNATADIIGSTFDGNTTMVAGGAVYNNGQGANGNAEMTIIASSFDNTGSPANEVIYNNGRRNGNAILLVIDTPFSGNSSGDAAKAASIIVNEAGDGSARVQWQGQNFGAAGEINCFTDRNGSFESVQCQ